MIVQARLVPFLHPRDRASRLPLLVLAGLAVLLVAVWNPVTTPGPMLCMMRLAFGIPCPLCGGTRGAALCMRGRVMEGLAYNPLSLPALVLAFALFGRWSFEYLSGKRVVVEYPRWVRWGFNALMVAALVATWIYLLSYRMEDDPASSWLGQLLGWLGASGAR